MQRVHVRPRALASTLARRHRARGDYRSRHRPLPLVIALPRKLPAQQRAPTTRCSPLLLECSQLQQLLPLVLEALIQCAGHTGASANSEGPGGHHHLCTRCIAPWMPAQQLQFDRTA